MVPNRSIGSYWSILLAIAGLATLGASPPNKDNGEPSENSNKQITPAFEGKTITLGEANKSSELEKPCKEGENQRSSDLCAQWKAADAAQSSSLAAWLFGALGSLIGGLTLAAAWSAAKWAKRAAQETERSAQAAEAALVESAKSAVAAQETLKSDRAWICHSSIQSGDVTNSTFIDMTIKKGFHFVFNWKNFGRSPATDVRITIGHVVIPQSAEIPTFNVDFREEPATSVIGPERMFNSPMIFLDDDETAKFIDGPFKAIIYCKVEYRDIFTRDVIRVSECCMTAVHQGGTFEQDGKTTKAIMFYSQGLQNTVT